MLTLFTIFREKLQLQLLENTIIIIIKASANKYRYQRIMTAPGFFLIMIYSTPAIIIQSPFPRLIS